MQFILILLSIHLSLTFANVRWSPWYSPSTCNCNGYSEKCYFDKELFRLTGHGGHCVDCAENRAGPNCERCKENYYQRFEDNHCVACNCNEIGSRNLQCNSEGKCQCKPGVTGDKCDRCANNFYDFGPHGCKSCDCYVPGSLRNTPSCDPVTGICTCKKNVEGKRCRICLAGFFNLALENEFGCTPCYCHGHSSDCMSAAGYSKAAIESSFVRGIEKWTASAAGNSIPLQYDAITQTVSVIAPDRDNVYFVAPERFLGDQKASYNQYLTFSMKIGENSPVPTAQDIILEGGNGMQLTQPISGQKNRAPTTSLQEFKFKLHEDPEYKWQPPLTSQEFMSVLSNLSAIKIRGTYTLQGRGFLDDVRLESAQRGAAGEPADWVEHCNCPKGYIGQFCESCAPGFHHDPPNGGPFALCVPCNCNGHADICDSETGQCICEHNTAGSNCELCKRGYYGHPLQGTPDDCKPCPCPDNGPCILRGNNPDPACINCTKGRKGHRCETCTDGYFGDPTKGKECKPCECNNNIDLNAVHNCDHVTGRCLKCVYNTAGFNCEECLPGYYGDALSSVKEEGCKPCECSSYGTLEYNNGTLKPCKQLDGYCFCKPHVIGKNCDKCEDGYYNIKSGEGCIPCDCDPEGSYNRTCDEETGECKCRPGITGRRCDVCMPNQYGFSREGCKPCDCDKFGSQHLQCDANGQCPCLENVEGRRCDRCKENMQNRQSKCVECPHCYNLVQEAVNIHRQRLAELEDILRKINNSPTVIKDEDFEKELQSVQEKVHTLLTIAKEGSGVHNKSLAEQMDELRSQLHEIEMVVQNNDARVLEAKKKTEEGETNIAEAEEVLPKIYNQLKNISNYLDVDGTRALAEAKKQAELVGTQNKQMTVIAKEARLKSDSNLIEAKKIHDLAENAKNTSEKAYDIVKQAITKYSVIGLEIYALENELKSLEDKFRLVQSNSHSAAEMATEASQKALNLLVSELTIPDVDVPDLQKQIDKISDDGVHIKEQADFLLRHNKDFFEDITKKIDQSEALLKEAHDQQSATSGFLAEVHGANIKAKEAVERGLKTSEEANKTLQKLSQFDDEVKKEKEKAQKALQSAPEIMSIIKDVLDKSEKIDAVLTPAEDNIDTAVNITNDTLQNANLAKNEAEAIKKEANKTKSEAFRLSTEANNLRLRVDNTELLINKYDKQVAEDVNMTNEVNHKVGQAKTNVTAVKDLVDKAMEEVKEIILQLNNLPEIDDEDLDRLEQKLTKAEKEIKAADLDHRIRELTDAKNMQTLWVKNFEDEVNRLRAEVDNIDDIRKALPMDCFKRYRLEPSE